jgi:hypothetical protein
MHYILWKKENTKMEYPYVTRRITGKIFNLNTNSEGWFCLSVYHITLHLYVTNKLPEVFLHPLNSTQLSNPRFSILSLSLSKRSSFSNSPLTCSFYLPLRSMAPCSMNIIISSMFVVLEIEPHLFFLEILLLAKHSYFSFCLSSHVYHVFFADFLWIIKDDSNPDESSCKL